MKSVFRQKKYEILYRTYIENMSYQIRGGVYHTRPLGELQKYINNDYLEDNKIGEYEIDLPKLKAGDKFFLYDINKEVEIKSVLISSDNSVVYYVEDKLIETENTQKSFEKSNKELKEYNSICKKEQDSYNLQYNNINDETKSLKYKIEELKAQYDWYKSEYKYKHKFFNF